MTVPPGALGAVIWIAVGAVVAGAVYLLFLLIREWRRGELW